MHKIGECCALIREQARSYTERVNTTAPLWERACSRCRHLDPSGVPKDA